MHVNTYPLGELQTNCYVLEDMGSCLIIDPGDSADFITEQIQRSNLQVEGIIVTHGHCDHVLAAEELRINYGVSIFCSSADQFLLTRASQTADHFSDSPHPRMHIKKTVEIMPGKMSLGHFSFSVLATPGHTPGSICIYFKKYQILFTGDTLFYHAIGSVDHSYSDKTDLQHSIDTIFHLPEGTIIYPGHGMSSTVGEEKRQSRYRGYF